SGPATVRDFASARRRSRKRVCSIVHWRARALGRRARLSRARRPSPFTPAQNPLEGGARGRTKVRRLLAPSLHPVPLLDRARTGFMFLDAALSRFLRRATRPLVVAAFALTSFVSYKASAQVPGELRGRVIDATTGRSIAGARIETADRVEPVQSDADGSYVLR